ncbi:hypothetical protein RDWZM_010061 [Blomia tropicalis]|uniref:G-protein coupled receptors family 1 profile domain-containing protein n=1 Tax=Blomia tropicalis TaxID=40697 RepID=A0A9Q0RJQ2_BLOTA|nr:hypothetical protein RDWZM_010061 [Blomia tropicalis]
MVTPSMLFRYLNSSSFRRADRRYTKRDVHCARQRLMLLKYDETFFWGTIKMLLAFIFIIIYYTQQSYLHSYGFLRSNRSNQNRSTTISTRFSSNIAAAQSTNLGSALKRSIIYRLSTSLATSIAYGSEIDDIKHRTIDYDEYIDTFKPKSNKVKRRIRRSSSKVSMKPPQPPPPLSPPPSSTMLPPTPTSSMYNENLTESSTIDNFTNEHDMEFEDIDNDEDIDDDNEENEENENDDDDNRSSTSRRRKKIRPTLSPEEEALELLIDRLLNLDIIDATVIIIGGFLSIVTIIGNLLVMIAFKIDRKLQKISNFYLLSLAVADFLIGFISMPLALIYIISRGWPLGSMTCDFWLSVDYLDSNASVLNLLLISFDRYMAVTRPLSYRSKRTRKQTCILIAFAWIISALLWPPWIFAWPSIEGHRTVPLNQCYIPFLESNQAVTIITAVCAFWIPVTCICVINYVIWKYARNSTRGLRNVTYCSHAVPPKKGKKPDKQQQQPKPKPKPKPKVDKTNEDAEINRNNSEENGSRLFTTTKTKDNIRKEPNVQMGGFGPNVGFNFNAGEGTSHQQFRPPTIEDFNEDLDIENVDISQLKHSATCPRLARLRERFSLSLISGNIGGNVSIQQQSNESRSNQLEMSNLSRNVDEQQQQQQQRQEQELEQKRYSKQPMTKIFSTHDYPTIEDTAIVNMDQYQCQPSTSGMAPGHCTSVISLSSSNSSKDNGIPPHLKPQQQQQQQQPNMDDDSDCSSLGSIAQPATLSAASFYMDDPPLSTTRGNVQFDSMSNSNRMTTTSSSGFGKKWYRWNRSQSSFLSRYVEQPTRWEQFHSSISPYLPQFMRFVDKPCKMCAYHRKLIRRRQLAKKIRQAQLAHERELALINAERKRKYQLRQQQQQQGQTIETEVTIDNEMIETEIIHHHQQEPSTSKINESIDPINEPSTSTKMENIDSNEPINDDNESINEPSTSSSEEASVYTIMINLNHKGDNKVQMICRDIGQPKLNNTEKMETQQVVEEQPKESMKIDLEQQQSNPSCTLEMEQEQQSDEKVDETNPQTSSEQPEQPEKENAKPETEDDGGPNEDLDQEEWDNVIGDEKDENAIQPDHTINFLACCSCCCPYLQRLRMKKRESNNLDLDSGTTFLRSNIPRDSTRSDTKATKTLLTIVLAFVATWTPYNVLGKFNFNSFPRPLLFN